jgi:pimeloyl-ACP methyl ester carboxylesterase
MESLFRMVERLYAMTMPIHNIYFFHGKGGRPEGSVRQIEELLEPVFPAARFSRPALLHGDPSVRAEESLAALRQLEIPEGTIIIGISLGGLLAARLQETSRSDLRVVAISSPTWADSVKLAAHPPGRLALYSSSDEVILGRTRQWPDLADSQDLPWLTHDTDVHKHRLVPLIAAWLRGDHSASAAHEERTQW